MILLHVTAALAMTPDEAETAALAHDPALAETRIAAALVEGVETLVP